MRSSSVTEELSKINLMNIVTEFFGRYLGKFQGSLKIDKKRKKSEINNSLTSMQCLSKLAHYYVGEAEAVYLLALLACSSLALLLQRDELGLLDLQPRAHLVPGRLVGEVVEGVAGVRNDHVVVVDHVSRLHALLEAAAGVELLGEEVHRDEQQRRDGPPHLLVRHGTD